MAEFRDIDYTSEDGLQLYARDYPCTGAAQRGVVLCLHGLTRNSADFHPLACHLQARYRVIAADQRGRGRSEYDSQSERYAVGTYVADMFRLMDALSLSSVIVIGTSMGGLMAMIMAMTAPERIPAMVINDIGPEINPAGLARIQGYVGKSGPVRNWDEAVAQSRDVNGIAFPDFTDAQWLAFTRGLYREVEGGLELAYDPAIAAPMGDSPEAVAPPDLWPVFDAIANRPILVVRGESSDILASACVARMRAQKPDLEVCEVPRRGHAPTLDEADARASIDSFLAELYASD